MSRMVATPAESIARGSAQASVTGLVARWDGTTLLYRTADGPASLAVAAEPNLDAARRRLACTRRLDCVRVIVDRSGVRAQVRGVRHRLPFASGVPVSVALGLVELGVLARVLEGDA